MNEVIFDHGDSGLELRSGVLGMRKDHPYPDNVGKKEEFKEAYPNEFGYRISKHHSNALLFGGTITRWLHETLPTLCYYDTPMGKWWSTDTRVCTPDDIQ